MKRMYLADSGKLLLAGDQVVQPQPGQGEVLVHVYAVGITPTELLWYPTLHTKSGDKRNQAVPGHEFSGVIAALGEGVADLEIGQEIYGMNDWFADGALAEYCITQPASIAPKPRSLTHVQAASVPIGALTAWQGLIDRARLKAGERVLVHGAAGAVGVYALQLARLRGAHVIATASSSNAEFIARLGAVQVIDYRVTRFEDVVRSLDVVFDTIGGDTLQRSWGVLAPSGRMITIAAAGEAATDDRVKQAFFIVEPNRDQLVEIASLIDSGQLQTVVDTVLPFVAAPAAYSGQVANRQGRGKMVVDMMA